MANLERLPHDPKKIRVKSIRLNRRVIFMRSDIAAFYENLFAQHDSDGVPCHGWTVRRCVPTLNSCDNRRFVCRRKNQLIPRSQRSRFDPAGNDAPSIKSINILNAEAERKIEIRFLRLQTIECFENARTAIPLHFHTRVRDVLALFCRGRNNWARFQPKISKKLSIFSFDFLESLLGKIHQVELVNDDDNLFNTK